MARSLQISQEESASTSPLLTGFLALAALVLVAGALATVSAGGAAIADQTPPASAPR